MKRTLGLLAAVISLAGCGSVEPGLRKYVAGSPHRSIGLIPLERSADQVPYAAQTYDQLHAELAQYGFQIMELDLVRGAFDKSKGPTAAGKKAGVQAVLLGRVEEAFERVTHLPASFEFETVPPPACCSTPAKCKEPMVYDEKLQEYVAACTGSHRRKQVSKERIEKTAGYALHLRLVDVATDKLLWEGSERKEATPLSEAARRVIKTLSKRLAEDVRAQGL